MTGGFTKIVGTVVIGIALITGLVKRFLLTEKEGVRKTYLISPARKFWQEKFPAYEIAGILLVAGFVFLILP